MSDLRFVQKLASAPWLCDAEYVEFMNGILRRHLERSEAGIPFDRRAIEQATGKPLGNSRSVTVTDGVARIPVDGPIFRHANIFTEVSGAVSTERLAKDFTAAHDDPEVRAILFVFDSPGGEATGINEMAGLIRSRRDLGEKRIEAYVDGDCASAAYWLASATSRITADATASLGSIGVVSRVRNPDALGKRDTIEFWNRSSPKKRMDYRSYEGQEAVQERVDALGDVFVAAVADNRGVSAEKVERDFGQGFVLTGAAAVAAGLADALGSEEEVLRRLADGFRDDPGEAGRGYPPTINPRREAATLAKGEGAEGVLAKIRAVLGGAAVDAAADDATAGALDTQTDEGRTVLLEERNGRTVVVADDGEELELSAADRDRLASGRDEELRTENARLADELADSREREKNLRARLEEAEGGLTESAVDRELDGFRAGGVPPYLADLARPALLAGGDEAGRWRQVLDGAEGTVETGERGVGGDARGEDAMSDDEKVRATIRERGLDERADYARVATELVAAGEIRRDSEAADEGEE